jgi:hypothetical protein
MKRNDFFKTAARACLACAGAMALEGHEIRSAGNQAEKSQDPGEIEERLDGAYIRTLMESMEKHLDEKTRARVMEDCGRACARRGGLLRLAEKRRADLKGFLETMARSFGKDLVFLDGKTVHWGYPRCLCELVADGPERLPRTYCLCSVGWVLEMFETVIQGPVRVELLQAVKQGASSCKFLIHL